MAKPSFSEKCTKLKADRFPGRSHPMKIPLSTRSYRIQQDPPSNQKVAQTFNQKARLETENFANCLFPFNHSANTDGATEVERCSALHRYGGCLLRVNFSKAECGLELGCQ
jgi:hypothetical protein